MTKQQWRELLTTGPVLLDGATGSVLRQRGMPAGVSTELWVLEHREVLMALQQEYVQAGCQVLYAPTFQAQPLALEQAGWRGNLDLLIGELVSFTREAADGKALVAGDISTMAGTLDAWDEGNFDILVDQYRRQIAGLLKAGVDLLAGETLMYPQEAEAILTAAELEGGAVPVLLTFTMQPDGSLFSGRDVAPVLRELEEAGADAVGFNCVAAGDRLPGLVSKLRRQVRGPLISKPNAGNPTINALGQAVYDQTPEEFARWQVQAAQMGAGLLGGCCGTGPAYLKCLGECLR